MISRLLDRFKTGLAKTRDSMTNGLKAVFSDKVSPATLDQLTDILLGADLGISLTQRLIASLKEQMDQGTDEGACKERLKQEIKAILRESCDRWDTEDGDLIEMNVNQRANASVEGGWPASPTGAAGPQLPLVAVGATRAPVGFNQRANASVEGEAPQALLVEGATRAPVMIAFFGVNGVGKTTTIGKLACRLSKAGKTVLLAAGDTFRAGAIEQLSLWGKRAGAGVIRSVEGADPSAVIFDAVKAACARGSDYLLIDTAGRLQTNTNLMSELKKITRVTAKALASTSYERILVLDAVTGQNAISQAKQFHEAVGVTGIIMTKLDSTARGGILIAVAEMLRVPVLYVGMGEGMDDLLPFHPDAYVDALF